MVLLNPYGGGFNVAFIYGMVSLSFDGGFPLTMAVQASASFEQHKDQDTTTRTT